MGNSDFLIFKKTRLRDLSLSFVPAASEPGCGLVGGGDDDDNSQEEEEEEARHGWYGIGFRVLLV